jgi:formylglycine-generating enzyme required for sulfatase activity
MNQNSLKCSLFLFLLIGGCDNASQVVNRTPQEQEELQKYLTRIKKDLVYVKGGRFWMGDFCKKMRNGGPYCSSEKDTKPLHEVELTSYSISKFKVTHEDYKFYLKIAGLSEQIFAHKFENEMLSDMTYFKRSPAIVTWTEANEYCNWLRKESGQPFSLPTEAQWEYAARSRGQYILVSTDNGVWRSNAKDGRGENYATDVDRHLVEDSLGINSILINFSVDKYPPNSIGLFGMAENGYEWVLDWYDPDYYSRSPVINPQGPAKPVIKDDDSGQYLKVLRGGNNPDPSGNVGLTFFRGYKIKDNPYPASTTVRCVVNSPVPIK